ncbi:MAG TPA: hypothetical protein VMU04_16165 [Candidatus Acidoferrum sp.]|nr:hypothetical protein [Candidatus Acidoferrum sp.]
MAAGNNPEEPEARRTYAWRWWVLAAVLLGIALAVLWMSWEVARTRMIRDLSAPAPQTNR